MLFGGIDRGENGLADTWDDGFTSASHPLESCAVSTDDRDGDGLRGCADVDCVGICDPLCAAGGSCTDASRPRCGDAICSSIEDYLLCPDDCTR